MIEGGRRRPPRVAPLAPLALAASLGVIADRFGDPWGTSAWAGLAMAASGLAAIGWRWPRASGWAIALAFGAMAAGWHHYWYSDLAPDDPARWASGERRPCWIRGVVVEGATYRAGEDGPRDRGSTRSVVALTAMNDGRGWRGASGRVAAWVAGDRSDLAMGRPVEASGTLGAVEGPLNPGEFDPRPMFRARGIRLRLSVSEPSGVWDDPTGDDWPWHRRMGWLRAWSRDRLKSGLDPATVPLASALLLGRREAVDPEINDAFARTGTTHLLAISGLHLQMLAVVIGATARRVGLGRLGALVVVLASTIGYSVLVGLAPSVVRSATMTVGACGAGLRDRCAKPGNLLSGSVLATLLWNPSDLFDVGCQLSFLGVAAIVWLVPAVLARDAPVLSKLDELERRTEPWWKMLGRLGLTQFRAGVIASAVAWLAAWPLVALRFHLVSPVAIGLNLILIPLTSLALLLAGLTLGLSAAWGPLGWAPGWACGLCLDWTEVIVRWGMELPWGHGFVPGPSWWWVLTFYAWLGPSLVAMVRCRPSVRWWWRATLAWGLIGAVGAMVPARSGSSEAEVLSVGHGLAVLIRSPSGATVLYDCGKMGDPHVGRRVIAPALWSRGVRRLDAILLSHADADHYNGLPDLLDRFEVGALRVPPGFDSSANPGASKLVAEARSRGIAVAPIASGDRIDLGVGTVLSVLHPPGQGGPAGSTDNARSVVLEVAASGGRLLLTGDLEREGLDALMSRPRPPIGFEAMLSPHHGGRTSNPARLYDWARPGLVIVSQRPPIAGSRDPLGPIAEGRSRLLRTWESGAVRLRWGPSSLVASGFLDQEVVAEAPKGSAWSGLIWALAGLVIGAALWLAVTVIEWGAWALVAPGRRLGKSRHETPSGLPIAVTAPDGARLVGEWFPGEGPGGRTILLLHGMAEDRTALLGRVPVLTRRGWNVAALDARASGQSGGRRVTFGAFEADDLRVWLDALSPLAGPSPIFAAWGRSMGAATALKAASIDPRFAALVLEAPYADLLPTVAAVLRRRRIPGWLAPLVLMRARHLAGVALDRPRPIDLAPIVTASTLILHGTADPIVPIADARSLAAAFARADEFVAVEGAGHANVVGIGGEELMDRVGRFLDGIGGRSLPPEDRAGSDSGGVDVVID